MSAITDNSERPAGVRAAVEALCTASQTPAKQRKVKASDIVEDCCRYAFDDGLDADALRAVVQVVSRKTELDQTSVTNLIKNLYPAQRVSADIVVTVVGALGQGKGKPTPGTQNGLVKWLIAVHEIIEDPKVLPSLYGVLFGMLDMISIRTSLCHLLSLLTRRKHVKPYRIQQLLQFSRGFGNEPALQGLLRIYKDYYPDIILSSTSATRNSFPPRPDEEWQKRILAIKDASNAVKKTTSDQHKGFKVLRKGHKRGKVDPVPEVHTFHAHESSVTLEEIDNAEDFVGKLERIEPPGQMVSFLTDPLLQKYVALNPSPLIMKRIELWLATCLEQEYEAVKSGQGASASLPELLNGLYQHAQYSKNIHPVVSAFLEVYLPIWDGSTAVDALLGILSYIPKQDFQDVHQTYFAHVERALASQGSEPFSQLLHFYSDLLEHWTHQHTQQNSLAAGSPWTSTDRKHLETLTTHISTLSTSLLLSLPTDAASPLTSSITTFYESLSLRSRAGTGPIILPPPHLSSLLAQGSSLTTLSRICGLYANFKAAFDAHSQTARISDYFSANVTNGFNDCLRHLHNLLWGSQRPQLARCSFALFVDSALQEPLSDYLKSIGHEFAPNGAFGLTHNAWLASSAAAAWHVFEDEKIASKMLDRHLVTLHQGPVTLQSLELLNSHGGVDIALMEYKRFVLQWLADRGNDGLKRLMYATNAKLRK